MSWFKQFMPKEPAGLEGRVIDIGSLKIHVRNAIAEGGFSCVYLARDAGHPSKQYALKHMICNDEESLDLVKKEISVLRILKGHPNVVTLHASTIFDMGRTKEALLVMEFCEKSLVTVLENRGAGYFEEKQVLMIFRDVCNAVFAMHCQSPPIAHRDLKAENVLLGANDVWKLCDFGSTSTNHKCFDRPEEMGIEEDNIRKHTTPAYRAPEMWDLFRKEIISEKVDIWALGCLLFRICYFKSAFDGESKLQILNGNYRIPELPKYSSSMTDLIKDMLQASPDDRPDITQVWFRVNLQLPEESQKQTPDGPITITDDMLHEGVPKRSHLMPRRSPPPPPSSREQVRNVSPHTEREPQHSRNSPGASNAGGAGGPLGAFWSTQHAQNSQTPEAKGPLYDKEPISQMTSKNNQLNPEKRTSPTSEQHIQSGQLPKRSDFGKSLKKSDDGPTEDFEIRFDTDKSSEKTKESVSEIKATFQNNAFNNFVAEFDTTKLNSGSTRNNNIKSMEKDLEAEIERLKEQLKDANMEKAEITSKYEKLSAICRSQRQEIHELKQISALATAIPSPPNKDSSKNQSSPGNWQSPTPQREKIEGPVWELQQGLFTSPSASPSPQSKSWQPFAEETNTQSTSKSNHPRSVRTTNGHQNTKQASSILAVPANESWGFGHDSFTAVPLSGQISRAAAQGSTSQRFSSSEAKKVETKQPAGWAGF